YAIDNNGWLFPTERGADKAHDLRWPMLVFKPPKWNPPVLICPADENPLEEHSYVLNSHLPQRLIRDGGTKGVSSSAIIVIGEKKSTEVDYYMDPDEGDFERLVEFYRHGLYLGSNYAYLDCHVDTVLPQQARGMVDPWDPAAK